MNPTLLVLLASQLVFTSSDLLARSQMSRHGFALATFLSGWFLGYTLLRILATFGQLFVLATLPVGRAMALFGALAILLSNVLGFLLLREVLSPTVYLGVVLAIVSVVILAYAR